MFLYCTAINNSSALKWCFWCSQEAVLGANRRGTGLLKWAVKVTLAGQMRKSPHDGKWKRAQPHLPRREGPCWTRCGPPSLDSDTSSASSSPRLRRPSETDPDERRRFMKNGRKKKSVRAVEVATSQQSVSSNQHNQGKPPRLRKKVLTPSLLIIYV